MLQVPIVRLDPELALPQYAHPGDAGLDLCARLDAFVPSAGGRVIVPTGISIAIPLGFAGFVLPRSGLALKHGVTVVNSPGLIDSAYRGEIRVVLLNTDATADYQVHRGDRIAQLVLQRVEEVSWQEVLSLAGDDRGGVSVRKSLDGSAVGLQQVAAVEHGVGDNLVDLVADDEGDDLSDAERLALHDALSSSWRSAEAGRLRPVSEILDDLRQRR